MEKVYTNVAIKDALGEPIEKGPWYNASLAVAHKRHSVSCTFPVSGPQGNGVLQLKAVKNNTGVLPATTFMSVTVAIQLLLFLCVMSMLYITL